MYHKLLKRQWKRLSFGGFLKRLGQYIVGQSCYTKGCKDRMLLIEVSIRHCVYERWRCEGCEATKGDLY